MKIEYNDKLSANHEGPESSDSIGYSPSKGTFLILLALLGAGALIIGFFFWYVPTVGLTSIHPLLPVAVAIVVGGATLLFFGGAVLILLTVATGSAGRLPSPLRWMLFKLYMPLVLMAGSLAGLSKKSIEAAFVEINNQMVVGIKKRVKAENLLLLMPHCIQFEDCKIKVTKNVKNCVSCGKCEIASLLAIIDEYGVNLFVSTGGTLARRKVAEHRPDAVIAVACERDLVSGLLDAYPMPVYAIVNTRPHGYCVDTGVAVEEVKGAISLLLA